MRFTLAIEGGATRSTAGLYTEHGELAGQSEAGPSNPTAYGLSHAQVVLVRLGRQTLAAAKLPVESGHLDTVVAGVSGAGAFRYRNRLAEVLSTRLDARRAIVCDDLRPLVYANAGSQPAMLVVAGTGSSVLVQVAADRQGLVGGRGALFGEPGGGYGVAVAGLRAAAAAIDGLGPATTLTQSIPAALGLDTFNELPAWAGKAEKAGVAALARIVVEDADKGDEVALRCVQEQARELASHAAVGLRHLPRTSPSVFVLGGLMEHAPLYRKIFETELQALRPGTTISVPRYRGHLAMAALARATTLPSSAFSVYTMGRTAITPDPQSPTEAYDDSEAALDSLDASGIVARMNREDALAVQAVNAERDAVAAAIEAAADALRSGGRIIYVGAGTSGRLGVLDASECPATFGVAPSRVLAIIAGGERAIRTSVEGAEDESGQAVVDMAALDPRCGPNDLVVGIAASGHTPYTRAALAEATRQKARTALVCCNPDVSQGADIVIALPTGPEVLSGSTRLKAGTATKMVLNMISTGAMALAGYVYEGRMIGVRPVNAKLRARAIRIVAALTAVSEDEAERLLQKAEGSIPVAVVMARKGVDAPVARRQLSEAGGVLREVLAKP